MSYGKLPTAGRRPSFRGGVSAKGIDAELDECEDLLARLEIMWRRCRARELRRRYCALLDKIDPRRAR